MTPMIINVLTQDVQTNVTRLKGLGFSMTDIVNWYRNQNTVIMVPIVQQAYNKEIKN